MRRIRPLATLFILLLIVPPGRSAGAAPADDYVAAEFVGDASSLLTTNIPEWQQATRWTRSSVAWDFVYTPQGPSKPLTDVTLSDFDNGNLPELAAHSYVKGYAAMLDVRPGTSCANEYQSAGAPSLSPGVVREGQVIIAIEAAFVQQVPPNVCRGGGENWPSFTYTGNPGPGGIAGGPISENFDWGPKGIVDSLGIDPFLPETSKYMSLLADQFLFHLSKIVVAVDLKQLHSAREVKIPYHFDYNENTAYARAKDDYGGYLRFWLTQPGNDADWTPLDLSNGADRIGDTARRVAEKSQAYQFGVVSGGLAALAGALTIAAARAAPAVPALVPAVAMAAASAGALTVLTGVSLVQYNDPPAGHWRQLPVARFTALPPLPAGLPPAVVAYVQSAQQIRADGIALATAIDRAGAALKAGDRAAYTAQLAAARRLDLALVPLCQRAPALAQAAWKPLLPLLTPQLIAQNWGVAVSELYAKPMSAAAVATLRQYGFTSTDLSALQAVIAKTPPPGLLPVEQLTNAGPTAVASLVPSLQSWAKDLDMPA